MSNPYREQAADAALALAERIQAAPDVADALEAAGADVAVLVATAEAAVGAALRAPTGRTEALPSTRRDECGVVPVHRTMGRGTEADEYELLADAPVGRPESLRAAEREAAVVRDEYRWAVRNVLADTGLLSTRKQRRNAKRAERYRKAGMR